MTATRKPDRRRPDYAEGWRDGYAAAVQREQTPYCAHAGCRRLALIDSTYCRAHVRRPA